MSPLPSQANGSRCAKPPLQSRLPRPGKVYEIYAARWHGSLSASSRWRNWFSGSGSGVVVDRPRRRSRRNSRASSAPSCRLHSVIRIDEVRKHGVSKVRPGRVQRQQFPFPVYTPAIPGRGQVACGPVARWPAPARSGRIPRPARSAGLTNAHTQRRSRGLGFPLGSSSPDPDRGRTRHPADSVTCTSWTSSGEARAGGAGTRIAAALRRGPDSRPEARAPGVPPSDRVALVEQGDGIAHVCGLAAVRRVERGVAYPSERAHAGRGDGRDGAVFARSNDGSVLRAPGEPRPVRHAAPGRLPGPLLATGRRLERPTPRSAWPCRRRDRLPGTRVPRAGPRPRTWSS